MGRVAVQMMRTFPNKKGKTVIGPTAPWAWNAERARRSRPPVIGLVAALLAGSAAAAVDGDWPTFGGDAGGMRYSRLDQITPSNAANLRPIWVYHMKPANASALAPQAAGADDFGPSLKSDRFLPSQAPALAAEGKLFLATPYSRIVALDPATGAELWAHDLPEGVRPATRGMEYWAGDGSAPSALIFGTTDGRLRALRARDGRPVDGFGERGSIDLRTPDVMVTGADKPYSMTSPPIVYKDLVITGAAVGEAIGGALGDVRAWDVRTGKHVWTFRSVPRPGELGAETWAGDSARNRSGVNVWGMMTVDVDRGIVYMPFGAPSYDRVGVDRPGDNLFGSSIVAADARTGRYLWHFQMVRHDIWDLDTQAPPTLFEVKQGEQTIPAVGLINKSNMLFILDRVTGKPIYPIEDRAVPPSTVPGERASPTQPFTVKPPPLMRMSISIGELSRVTPEHGAFCRALVADNNMALGGPYLPPTYKRPMVFVPGQMSALYGGSIDPGLGYYVVNVHTLSQINHIVDDGKGFFTNRGNARFWDPRTRLPCHDGSWGDLVAINVNTGEIAWRTRHGVSDNLPAPLQATGRPSVGGPITTAGGLTFVAGTDDARLRAFETRTGREVWATRLPASAHTIPTTYSAGGVQYVAIVATGGSNLGSPIESDTLIAYALQSHAKPQPSARDAGPASPPAAKPAPVAATARSVPTKPSAKAAPRPPVVGLAQGKALMEAQCARCHGLNIVTDQRNTRAGWEQVVVRMFSHGYTAKERDVQTIIDYLARAYPAR